ncbi:glycosyltransferase [Acinetobacter sp. RF15A]|uniref:glycosyltransferase n=1 Tax=unclassified Acinetobacter TaxID=196816 RepID=UPI001190B635|nr:MULTISPECIES: glycosyltransferase [unclassified Acinetobacter]TSH76962.1 glycosyltransferase [Acinetobacter sp. RF15A]TSI18404.1 glycosyltransferase [Acinetobacter sp. RF15B]
MSYKYILTTSNFFREGPCGRVSHAKGFIEGLVSNDQSVTLVSDQGAGKFINFDNNLSKYKISNKPYEFLYEILKSIINREKIIIRWRPILPYLLLPFILLYKNIYFEVNSLTGFNSKNKLVHNIVKFSIFLISKFSKIIVVSESSKKQIISINPRSSCIYVMPNGFSSEFLQKFKLNNSGEAKNLVYFGRRQDYYDWDNLYEILENNPGINMHIFGFEEKKEFSNLTFHGPFEHKSLIEGMNQISNPILIIHPDDSDIAKSGSPMKLFEYAYLNIPVIIGDSLKDIAQDFDEFILYKSSSRENLELVIKDVIYNYDHYLDKSRNLRSKVEIKYSWKEVVKSWLETNH